jgi:hypothetical protein
MALRERRAQFGAFLARVGTTCGATQTSFHLRRDVDETTLKKVGLLCRSRASTLCTPYLAHVCHLQIRKYAHSLLTRTETTAPSVRHLLIDHAAQVNMCRWIAARAIHI